jgi:S-DNA-T family DNA segregation ATPase FtsK/SpoIIIE
LQLELREYVKPQILEEEEPDEYEDSEEFGWKDGWLDPMAASREEVKWYGMVKPAAETSAQVAPPSGETRETRRESPEPRARILAASTANREERPESKAGAVAIDKYHSRQEPGEDKQWYLPSQDLLDEYREEQHQREIHEPEKLEEILASFGVKATVRRVEVGPVVTCYELTPSPGTKSKSIVNLADDIALALASGDVRTAPIPGKGAIGIEVPNQVQDTVYFRQVVGDVVFTGGTSPLRIALGKDIAGRPVVAELGRMPHLLVAGATGSGKSIFINCLICSLLLAATPAEVKLMLVDPKMVELSQYNGIPHLLAPVVTDPKKAAAALRYLVREMEARFELFAACQVRDIDSYNRGQGRDKLPYIVIIIDELADLMMVASDIEEMICRLTQMARAAGMHLVLATQRPSVNVITGLIKANIPTRISFAVTSNIDSRTILDAVGAEKLLGRGDMLYSPVGLNKPRRVHGCFISEEEIRRVTDDWRHQGSPYYQLTDQELEVEPSGKDNSVEEFDDKFFEAGQVLIVAKMASASYLQRRLKVGYSRAARLMDMLEEAGVVSHYDGSKPREIMMTMEEFHSQFGAMSN